MTPPAKIDVFVNQAGYDAAGPKTATIRVEGIGAAPQSFAMVPDAGGKPVLQGNLTGPIPEPEAGGSNSNFVADFSALTEPGSYTLQFPGGLAPVPVLIVDDAYAQVFRLAMRSYLLQRCGQKLSDPVSGIAHGPDHLQPSVLDEDRETVVDMRPQQPRGGRDCACGRGSAFLRGRPGGLQRQ